MKIKFASCPGHEANLIFIFSLRDYNITLLLRIFHAKKLYNVKYENNDNLTQAVQ